MFQLLDLMMRIAPPPLAIEPLRLTLGCATYWRWQGEYSGLSAGDLIA
jgi:hypothetical protein